jgi:hypothetical protein
MKPILYLMLVVCVVSIWIGVVARYGSPSSESQDGYSQALSVAYSLPYGER